MRSSLSVGWLVLALNSALASEPADARTRAEPSAGFANPAISAQALDNAPPQLGSITRAPQTQTDRAIERTIERDINQLLERANNNRASTPPVSRRGGGGATRIDTNPIASAGDAAWLLGLIYAHGAGVVQDWPQAQLWFERALAKGQSLGAAGLAWCAIEGCKQPPDPAQARAYIASMRAQLPARALYLEWWVQSKGTPLVTSTPKAMGDPAIDNEASYRLPSRPLLVQAARLGDVHALIELGLEAVALGDKAQARQWFEQAAAGASSGPSAAAHNLRLLDQQQANSDPTINSHVSMDAATLLAMAQRNHKGLGQPANYAEAIRLYRLAQTKGSTAARDMLALIFSRPTASGQLDIAWMQRIAVLNLGTAAGGPANPSLGAPVFQRERSPLFDYLPTLWKARMRNVN